MDSELGLVQFIEQRPLEVTTLQGHVDSACALGLPEAFPHRRLDIITNGPSAALTPWNMCGPTMALNGALDLFTERGWEPTYFAACDPQELVTEFLVNAPFHTTFLLASQCHPSVFRRLQNRRVLLWHLLDGPVLPPHTPFVRHGSSITLTALHLARLLGYNDLHVWGWDCCVDPLTLTHHAAAHGDFRAELRALEHRTSLDGEPTRSFLTTNTWAFEAQQAVFMVEELRRFGVTTTVHGPGLVRHTLDFLTSLEPSNANARVA